MACKRFRGTGSDRQAVDDLDGSQGPGDTVHGQLDLTNADPSLSFEEMRPYAMSEGAVGVIAAVRPRSLGVTGVFQTTAVFRSILVR